MSGKRGVGLKAVCIKENPAVWSKEFLPALRAQFERRGIATSVYTQDVPAAPAQRERDAALVGPTCAEPAM